MSAVRVTATLVQSAAIGTGARADYRQPTLDHVPGSVLRGALAAAWLRHGSPDTEAFRTTFEGDGAFGPLHSATSLPIPLSIQLHKSGPRDTCNRWWWDAARGDLPPGRPPRCPDCGEPVVASTGQPVGAAAVVERTRVALDARGVARDGMLFRRAALVSGTVLTGWISGPAVAALDGPHGAVDRVRFGGERSIRGTADLVHVPAEPEPIEFDGSTLLLRLTGPGIFVDKYGLPTDKPSPVELSDRLGVKVKIGSSWTRWTEVGGWHMASGLPKPTDRAVVAGSTYRIECATAPTPDALCVLAASGVGLRRREGFGALGRTPAQIVTGSALLRAVAPAVAWSGWDEHARALRANTTWPITGAHPLRRALTGRQAAEPDHVALRRLHAVTDPDLATALLDELSRA